MSSEEKEINSQQVNQALLWQRERWEILSAVLGENKI